MVAEYHPWMARKNHALMHIHRATACKKNPQAQVLNLNIPHQPYTRQSTTWLSQPGMDSLIDAAGNTRTLAGLVFATRERNRNVRDQKLN